MSDKKSAKPRGKKGSKKKATIPQVRELIQAPYHFTPEEIGTMNADLRGELQNIDTLNDQRKQANADFKLRIDGAANKVKQLRLKLDSGSETRPMEAIVEFDTKRSKKSYLNPLTKEHIREEDMQPADWQLPMFQDQGGKLVPANPQAPAPAAKKPETPAETPAAKPKGKAAKEQKPSEPGVTNLGDALKAAAAGVELPLVSIVNEGTDDAKIVRDWKKAAKAAGWPAVAITLIQDETRKVDSLEKIVAILDAHSVRPGAKPEEKAEGDVPL